MTLWEMSLPASSCCRDVNDPRAGPIANARESTMTCPVAAESGGVASICPIGSDPGAEVKLVLE